MFHRAKKIPVAEKEKKKKNEDETKKESEKEKEKEREKKKRKIRLEMHQDQIVVDGKKINEQNKHIFYFEQKMYILASDVFRNRR